MTNAKKPCSVEKKKFNNHFDDKSDSTKRVIAFTMMAVNLFFWYFATTQINDWIYYEWYMSVTSTIFNTALYTVSSIVYAYLIYEIIKIEKFNFRNSFLMLGVMIALSISTLFIFPLPIV